MREVLAQKLQMETLPLIERAHRTRKGKKTYGTQQTENKFYDRKTREIKRFSNCFGVSGYCLMKNFSSLSSVEKFIASIVNSTINSTQKKKKIV